jgi:hypothetical protein
VLLGAADDGERDGGTHAVLGEQAQQVVDAAHRQLAEGHHQIAFAQAGAVGRTPAFDRHDEDCRFGGQAEVAHHALQEGNGLAGDTDIAPTYAAVANQARGNELGGVDGDGKADALGGLNNGRVDADDLATRVQQRPTRIAGVQGSVGLDDVFDQPSGARWKGATEGAHHARGDRGLKAVRVADRNRDHAWPNGL